MWKEQVKPALIIFALLTIITGVGYPLVVTGIAQLAFHDQAQGSLIHYNGQIIGSVLIGQNFTDSRYFWGRPSATNPGYNASGSSGSNLGPSNKDLLENIRTRIAILRAVDPDNSAPVPVDLVTASASGLDPHISLAAAYYQVARIARIRRLAPDAIRALVNKYTAGRVFGVLGEPVVNVLPLNLALDQLKK
jgi:K+-transporting ATPase ATPase C chain